MSTERIKTLRAKRGQVIAEGRAILEKAANEKREMTTEESEAHKKTFALAQSLKDQYEAEERQLELDREAAAVVEPTAKPDATVNTPEALRMKAYRNFLLTGSVSGDGAKELRDLSAGVQTTGGAIVSPMTFVNELIKFVDDAVFVRKYARKETISNSLSLGAPSLDNDMDDADWTTELGTGSADTGMAFGRRELTPHPMAKRIKVSNTLMRVSAQGVENLVRDRLGYKVGITSEKGYLTGDGNKKPLGVFVASADGVTTGRDVSAGNTLTSIGFDGLIAAKYSLKVGYRGRARWLFHRNAVEQISKLKDGQNNYIWRPSVRDGEPDRILNLPYDESEYVPNTFTTGLYVGLLADWSNYWIVDSLALQIQRLGELYAETNQTGFISRFESDGMPVLAEGFARVKLA